MAENVEKDNDWKKAPLVDLNSYMLYEQVLANPYMLEDTVGDLLAYLCKKENRSISLVRPDKNGTVFADFKLENGCEALDLEGETYVEVKTRLSNNSFNQFKQIVDSSKLPLLVVVLERTYLSLFEEALKDHKIKIITFGYLLNKAVDKEWKFSDYLSNKDGAEKSESDTETKIENKKVDVMTLAQTCFKQNHVTLFLGAGVSKSAGLPEWSSLLLNIIGDSSQKPLDKNDYPAIDVASFNSAIICARNLFAPFANQDNKLIGILKSSLYPPIKTPKALRTSPLIDTIVDICTVGIHKKKPRDGMTIITFNYDDLIESKLDSLRIPYQQIVNEGIIERGKLPIFHVHGILREHGANTGLPVLSEREYHRLYKSSFHWSNVEIEHALYRTTCIFIGLSMQDPNLRRLLEFVAFENNNDVPHFAILPKRDLSTHNWNAAIPTKYYKKEMAKDQHFVDRQEAIYKELGINVIWYDDGDHGKVPEILKKIAGKI